MLALPQRAEVVTAVAVHAGAASAAGVAPPVVATMQAAETPVLACAVKAVTSISRCTTWSRWSWPCRARRQRKLRPSRLLEAAAQRVLHEAMAMAVAVVTGVTTAAKAACQTRPRCPFAAACPVAEAWQAAAVAVRARRRLCWLSQTLLVQAQVPAALLSGAVPAQVELMLAPAEGPDPGRGRSLLGEAAEVAEKEGRVYLSRCEDGAAAAAGQAAALVLQAKQVLAEQLEVALPQVQARGGRASSGSCCRLRCSCSCSSPALAVQLLRPVAALSYRSRQAGRCWCGFPAGAAALVVLPSAAAGALHPHSSLRLMTAPA